MFEIQTPVAYRGNILVMSVGPGSYRLVSIGQQFLWEKHSLSASGAIDAGAPSQSLLSGCRSASMATKKALFQNCLGIVGVGHQGYHLLNRLSAMKNKRQIGKCIVEVRWKLGILELFNDRPKYKINGVEMVKTFETRTDWQAFRGKEQGDYEIYRFAKDNDSGIIPSGHRGKYKKRRPKAIESAPTSRKNSRATKSYGSTMVFSDSDQDDQDDRDSDSDSED